MKVPIGSRVTRAYNTVGGIEYAEGVVKSVSGSGRYRYVIFTKDISVFGNTYKNMPNGRWIDVKNLEVTGSVYPEGEWV